MYSSSIREKEREKSRQLSAMGSVFAFRKGNRVVRETWEENGTDYVDSRRLMDGRMED